MGSWWRSEEMEYVSVIVSEDAAHSCIRELGQMGKKITSNPCYLPISNFKIFSTRLYSIY